MNEWAFETIAIKDGKVQCPWWKREIDVWDNDKGCFSVCEFCNGTAQGEGVECLWRASQAEVVQEGKPKPLPTGVSIPKIIKDKVGGVLLAFSQTREDIKLNSDNLFKMARESYDATLRASIKEIGCEGGAHLTGGSELKALRERADWASQTIANTFHRDASRMLEGYNARWVKDHGSEEGMTRAWLGKQLREGLKARAVWKDKQIAITEKMFAIDRARLDFWRNNGIDGEVRVMPLKAVCPICQDFVRQGWVPLSEAYGRFVLPNHPNCLAEGQPVNTPDGLKPVETVKTGDLVLNEDGKPVVVKAAIKWPRQRHQLYLLSIGGRRVLVTGEHPILTSEGWIDARDVREGQMVRVLSVPSVPHDISGKE